jgi:hypothetical protein
MVPAGRTTRPAPLAASRGRRAVLHAVVAVLVLHTVFVLWVWNSWGEFGRGTVLVWMDFPASLLYLERADAPFLAGSLLAGGLQWTLLAALLTWTLGRSARRS